MHLSDNDRLIVVWSLLLCPATELGDAIGGHDRMTTEQRWKLAKEFSEGDETLTQLVNEEISMRMCEG